MARRKVLIVNAYADETRQPSMVTDAKGRLSEEMAELAMAGPTTRSIEALPFGPASLHPVQA